MKEQLIAAVVYHGLVKALTERRDGARQELMTTISPPRSRTIAPRSLMPTSLRGRWLSMKSSTGVSPPEFQVLAQAEIEFGAGWKGQL